MSSAPGPPALGFRQKESLGLAEARRGRRGARNAIANMGVAAVCALFAVLTPLREIFVLAFAGAFAAATADTLESEIGQLWGGRPRLLTTWCPVPAGTDGGVSTVGTLAGAAGALVLAGLGWAVGFYGASGFVAVAMAGFVATIIESLIGATLERAGLLNNEAVNTLNTLAGALLAVAFWNPLGRRGDEAAGLRAGRGGWWTPSPQALMPLRSFQDDTLGKLTAPCPNCHRSRSTRTSWSPPVC